MAVFILILIASPLAASTDYTVLLDLDNNAATGCTVTTAAGSFAGAEQRLITTVSNVSPLTVTSVVRQVCVAGPSTWGPSIAVNSPFAAPWAVGEHQGTGGLDVVDTYFPLGGVPHGFYRLGFTTSAGAGDALITANGASNGAAMLISNFSIGEIPTLGTWILLALAVTLVVLALVAIKAPHALAALVIVVLVITVGAGVAWASLVPDGNPSSWSGIAPLGIRTPLPAVGSAKIAAVFGTIENDTLFLRVDADVPRSPSVTTQPVDSTVAAGGIATFTAIAAGSPSPTVQWQVSTDGGVTFNDIPSATSTTLSFTAAASDDLHKYRAVFTNLAGTVTSDPATLSVAALSTITAQPNNNSLTAGGTATFTSTATSNVAPTIQWQVSTDGTTWNDVPGATSTTLSFVTALTDDLKQYRAVFTNAAGSVPSNTAYLFVATTIPTASLPRVDDFSVTDGGHLPLSHGWITQSGDFAVPGGALGTATAAATPQLNLATLNVVVLNSDQTVNVGALADGQFAALVACYSGPGLTNMYYAGVRRTGSTYTAEVWKNVGGVDTLMGSQTTSAPTNIEFQVNNGSLKLLVNGAPAVQLIDGSPLSGGLIGFLATQGVVFQKNYSA